MAYPNNPDSSQAFQNSRRTPFGINKVLLVGSIAYGPEDRHEGRVVQFGLSTGNISTTQNPNAQTEEYRETYDIVVYGNTARYLLENRPDKSTWLYVEGRLRKRKWYDKAPGSPRYGYDVVAQRIIILNKMVHAWERQRGMDRPASPTPPSYEPPAHVPEAGISGVDMTPQDDSPFTNPNYETDPFSADQVSDGYDSDMPPWAH